MGFLVKLIEVTETSCQEARTNLYANCTHVASDYWLFEGDEEFLHEGIELAIVGEEVLECYGDLSQSELKKLAIEVYKVDRCFL